MYTNPTIMGYILLPSLEELSLVRIAVIFYSDNEVENILTNVLTNDLRARELLEKKMHEKLSSWLSETLRKRIAEVILLLQDEIEAWRRDHQFLLAHIGKHLGRRLCWNSDGTIDRTETGKRLVGDDGINPKMRFILACTYFLEDEVVALWDRYEEIKKNVIALDHTNLSVRFWMEWLKEKDAKHWSEMLDEYLRTPHSRPWDIPSRISTFYHLLSTETKQNINIFRNSRVHLDDFRVCVNKMDQVEQTEMFRSHYSRALHICSMFPFRCLFLNMARQSFPYLSASDFKSLFRYLLLGYMRHRYKDFHLFVSFWQMSPAILKSEINSSAMGPYFPSFRIKMHLENESIPRDFKEILRKCLL